MGRGGERGGGSALWGTAGPTRLQSSGGGCGSRPPPLPLAQIPNKEEKVGHSCAGGGEMGVRWDPHSMGRMGPLPYGEDGPPPYRADWTPTLQRWTPAIWGGWDPQSMGHMGPPCPSYGTYKPLPPRYGADVTPPTPPHGSGVTPAPNPNIGQM